MRIFQLLAALGILAAGPAHSAAYKCTGANGKVSYQQVPCPDAASESRIDTGSEWRLLSSESYGAWGTTDIVGYNDLYFDPEHVVTVDGYPRVMFKKVNRVVRKGSQGQPDKQFFFYADCSTSRFSNYKEQRDDRPGKPDSNWSEFHWTMGSKDNARKVLAAICKTAAQP